MVDTTQDVGVAAAYAKTLIYYAPRKTLATHPAAKTMAKELLDRMWTQYRDRHGVAAPETRKRLQPLQRPPLFVPARLQRRDGEWQPR